MALSHTLPLLIFPKRRVSSKSSTAPRAKRSADEIAVIVGGTVTERGTHDELMAKYGTYSQLYSLQFRDNDTFDL